jgi:histidinol-phosphatase
VTEVSGFLEAAQAAADAAEVVIRQYYRSELDVTHKSDASPVTRADVESEQAIHAVLHERFPAHGFFGEETGRAGDHAEYVWLVDPIDGTKSFVRQFPFFSTQIALMQHGKVILGLSNAPMMGQRAWAVRGGGAFLNGNRVAVADTRTLGNAHVSTGNLKSLAISPAWPRLGSMIALVDRFRGYGDFYHYHLLASGSLDLVLESDVNILDIAALSLIVQEAGGSFTDLSGRPVDLETTSVLAAATPDLHALALQHLSW